MMKFQGSFGNSFGDIVLGDVSTKMWGPRKFSTQTARIATTKSYIFAKRQIKNFLSVHYNWC